MQFIKKVHYQKLHDHRIYKSVELTEELDVCNTTLWNYRNKGLPVVNPGESPPIYRGKDVKIFLSDLLKAQKRPLRPEEFWCVRCRRCVLPIPGSIKLKPLGCELLSEAIMIQITAECEICGSTIFKNTHRNKVNLFLEPHGLQLSDFMRQNS